MELALAPRKILGFELLERWIRALLAAKPLYAGGAFSSRRT